MIRASRIHLLRLFEQSQAALTIRSATQQWNEFDPRS